MAVAVAVAVAVSLSIVAITTALIVITVMVRVTTVAAVQLLDLTEPVHVVFMVVVVAFVIDTTSGSLILLKSAAESHPTPVGTRQADLVVPIDLLTKHLASTSPSVMAGFLSEIVI